MHKSLKILKMVSIDLGLLLYCICEQNVKKIATSDLNVAWMWGVLSMAAEFL